MSHLWAYFFKMRVLGHERSQGPASFRILGFCPFTLNLLIGGGEGCFVLEDKSTDQHFI